MRARAHVSVLLSGIGMASGQRVKRSITVRRYLQPRDSGRGPTRSIWTWSNLLAEGAKVWSGAFTWVWIFDLWQFKQVFAQSATCLLRPCHTNLDAIRRWVVFTPGWARAWIVSKTRLRHGSGTMGRALWSMGVWKYKAKNVILSLESHMNHKKCSQYLNYIQIGRTSL